MAIDRNLKDLHVKMTTFVPKGDMVRLANRFKEFARVDEITEFRLEMTPLIDSCEQKLAGYTNDNENMREMIRRFDEVISDKVNKMSLLTLEKKIGEKFVRIRSWDDLRKNMED